MAGNAVASETFNIGFDIGMNFATVTGLGDAQRRRSPLFGLFADWRFSEHAHLGVHFIPLSSRGAEGLSPQPLGDPTLDSLVRGGTMTRSITTIDIPVMLKYAPRRDTGVRFGAGPEISFILGANDRYTARGPTDSAVVIERDIGSHIGGIDAGFAVDLEWRWPLLAIGVRYYQGMTDLISNNLGTPSRSRVFSGSGRIPLGVKRKPKSGTP
jgi:hypothetical protein